MMAKIVTQSLLRKSLGGLTAVVFLQDALLLGFGSYCNLK